ncbi:MAG: AzlD domain-containing protein [Firmicutes bacterium]|nr:AzlD domain-containing protein [Bacillota bacterium]
MTLDPQVLLVIGGMALVTALPRILPLVLLSRFTLPRWLMRWLAYIPVAVLASLLARELVIPEGRLLGLANNLGLWATVPTLAVALLTRNLMATVLTGIAAMALLRALVG